jgi:hypothetical protein
MASQKTFITQQSFFAFCDSFSLESSTLIGNAFVIRLSHFTIQGPSESSKSKPNILNQMIMAQFFKKCLNYLEYLAYCMPITVFIPVILLVQNRKRIYTITLR